MSEKTEKTSTSEETNIQDDSEIKSITLLCKGDYANDRETIDVSTNELFISPRKYEYLDHTADVQLHAWGDSLEEAFEQCGVALFGYMTDLEYVEYKYYAEIQADGDDLKSLLYHYLDELLFLFSSDPFMICNKLIITNFQCDNSYKLTCKCFGEEFQIGKHPQHSEVKAITYSAMQILNEPDQNRYELFVIVDI